MNHERKQHLQLVDFGIGKTFDQGDVEIEMMIFKLQALAKRPQPPKEKT